jgi:hypothetical protein
MTSIAQGGENAGGNWIREMEKLALAYNETENFSAATGRVIYLFITCFMKHQQQSSKLFCLSSPSSHALFYSDDKWATIKNPQNFLFCYFSCLNFSQLTAAALALGFWWYKFPLLGARSMSDNPFSISEHESYFSFRKLKTSGDWRGTRSGKARMRKRAKLVSGQFIVLLGFSFSPLKRNSNERTSGKSQKTEAHPAHSMCVCVCLCLKPFLSRQKKFLFEICQFAFKLQYLPSSARTIERAMQTLGRKRFCRDFHRQLKSVLRVHCFSRVWNRPNINPGDALAANRSNSNESHSPECS